VHANSRTLVVNTTNLVAQYIYFFVVLLPMKLNATFFFNVLLHAFDDPALSVASVSIL
jgi:hypothetical protein